MLTYDLSRRGKTPLYEYLYHCIRNDILSGVLQSNERLPSKRALAAHLSVGVVTVENAYAQLLLEGYLYSIETQGYFVQPLPYTEVGGQSGSKESLPEHETPEHEYQVDFKANKSSLDRFPSSVWAKLTRELLSSNDPEMLKTVPYNGLFTLRLAIADYLLRSRGMRVSPAQIIIGAGTEYLYSRLLQLFGQDVIIATEDPGYKKFAEVSAGFGVLWDYIPIDESGMRVDRLERNRVNVIHVSPANHFPTGIVMPISRRQQLLEWASQDPSRYIIEDDYDSELRYAGKLIPTMYSIDRNQKVVYLNTFSKSLVPSIRISYMVLPQLLLDRYKATLSFYSCTVSSFEQGILAKFISGGYFERHINRMKNYYKVLRNSILQALQTSPLAKISTIWEQNAGTHFLLKVNTILDDDEILSRAHERDMNLAMLSSYCRYPSLDQLRTLVINYAGIETDKIDLAVKILEEIFQDDLKRK